MKHEAGCIGNRRMAVRVEAECAALCSEVGERQGNMMLDVLAVRAKAECAAGGVRGAPGSGGGQVDPSIRVSGPDLRRQSAARPGHQRLPQRAGATWQRP